MITQEEIVNIQKLWGNGLVELGKIYTTEGYTKAKEKAVSFINTYYDYSNKKENVLFKPTLASKEPFRTTFEGTLSYFIGGNPNYPEDKGFALTPYINVYWENKATRIIENTATVMGHYYFYTSPNNFVIVEYSFVYEKNDTSKIKIILQHSSLPYTP